MNEITVSYSMQNFYRSFTLIFVNYWRQLFVEIQLFTVKGLKYDVIIKVGGGDGVNRADKNDKNASPHPEVWPLCIIG